MTYSSFPKIDSVIFTHIFDLPMWCLHMFWLACVMLWMIWKMCTWPFVNRTLYFNYFLYVILFCFSEPCYIRVEIKTFLTEKDSLLQRLGVLYFSPWWYFRLWILAVFVFWILAYVRLGASNFVFVNLPLVVPAWLSAVCPWHSFVTFCLQ